MGSEFALIVCTQNSNFLTKIIFVIFRKDIVCLGTQGSRHQDYTHIFGQISMRKKKWSQRRLGGASDLKARPVSLKEPG